MKAKLEMLPSYMLCLGREVCYVDNRQATRVTHVKSRRILAQCPEHFCSQKERWSEEGQSSFARSFNRALHQYAPQHQETLCHCHKIFQCNKFANCDVRQVFSWLLLPETNAAALVLEIKYVFDGGKKGKRDLKGGEWPKFNQVSLEQSKNRGTVTATPY